MKIAIIADARSEHTRRWVGYLLERDEVLLLSTHPFGGKMAGVRIVNLPKVFSAGNSIARGTQERSGKNKLLAVFISQSIQKIPLIWHLWQRFNLIDVLLQGRAARRAVRDFRPDVVHAMRIQNEGYVGALTRWHPLIISVMGNDLVYTAKHSVLHRVFTKKVVAQCDGITADCQRDLRLAVDFGLKPSVAREYFPSNGGVDLGVFAPGVDQKQRKQQILYFRGISPLYRPITLMKAVSILAKRAEYSDVVLHVLAPVAAIPWFEEKRRQYGLAVRNFKIGGFLPPQELAQLLQGTAIVVSPTISDGTPNSMLEAMACGAFPVMSNLESVREWITSKTNGLLFDPESADELSASLALALRDLGLRQQAQTINYRMIRERADYSKVMPAIRSFYKQFVT